VSDFSGLEQNFALASVSSPALPDDFASTDVQPHEVGFHRLRGAREISRILHLRNEIALPAAALADSGFATREKKEMRPAWSVRSCASATR
jgi:hypothetical protein